MSTVHTSWVVPGCQGNNTKKLRLVGLPFEAVRKKEKEIALSSH